MPVYGLYLLYAEISSFMVKSINLSDFQILCFGTVHL